MGAAWTQYRQGLVYAMQHKQLDSAIAFIHGMWAMLPEKDRSWQWARLGVNPWYLVDFYGKNEEQRNELKAKIQQEIDEEIEHHELPPVPVATNLSVDAKGETMRQKILWIQRGIIIIENSISDWIHNNIDRASYG